MPGKIAFTITALLFFNLSAFSQDHKVISDFRFIGKVGIAKRFFDNWEIGLESTLKLERDASRIDEADFDLDVSYQPHRIVKLGVGYRYAINKKKSGSYKQKQRLYGDAELILRLERFRFEYRLRYQNVDDDYFQYDEFASPENILRNRARIKYNVPKIKLTPFFYSELYGKLGNGDDFPLKLKFALGCNYSFGKYGKVKIYYRIDRQLNNEHPYTYYSLGLGYRYEF
ncbi:MAG: DUF2490 domain-containing protein [Bacteroidales bacterium]|jgi:hypothetical protein